jgi:ubiquinone/menaquinone biosynthesis C-methylase UbiE
MHELFSQTVPSVEFKALDIEQDPVQQGFEEGSFDVVLASNVLHATKSLDVTLTNCKKLLKPGGQIVIMEFTHPVNNVSLIYGTLKGW